MKNCQGDIGCGPKITVRKVCKADDEHKPGETGSKVA
jgi:hypothetical protein